MENKNLRLLAHESYSYVPRTGENARGADVTSAFAVDFFTAGERLTKREAGARYIGIQYGSDVSVAADTLTAFLASCKGTSLNVAGNGIYTMNAHGFNQAQVNDWVYAVLSRVHARIGLTLIRSGGQTGVDQAGLVAAIALGIPAIGLYPASFRRRNTLGVEITSTATALTKELTEQAAVLTSGPSRKFHQDGSLPENGEVFVFGSNLAGRHGKGSALVAREYFGAKYGIGIGRQGQSYAIPTKDGRPGASPLSDPASTLPLADIRVEIEKFITHASQHPDDKFFVVRLGCGLASHTDAEIAPMFTAAPMNCSFPDVWQPWLAKLNKPLAPAINIWSGAPGLGGALTNMSERAKMKGCIKNSYPVQVAGVTYADSEAAYQALKVPGNDVYNDGLMVDLIALKFKQNAILFEKTTRNGGVAWLEKCSHFTQAKSERAQSWEGQGYGSRFIRNLIQGYIKAKTGIGPVTRVVHVKEAPYDVYIGRKMGDGSAFDQSEWHNPFKVSEVGSAEQAVVLFSQYLNDQPNLRAKVKSLRGKTLGCWCKKRENLTGACHGEVLAAAADGYEWVPPLVAQGDLF